MSKRLVIIDGKSVFYRGYYAMPSLSTKDGTPTGGVYGFATMALEIIKKLQPNYVCVAWDKPKTNIRSRLELYPQYKAGRKPAPPDFYVQVPILHDLLNSLGWPLYEADDYEADDLMGAFAKQAGEKDIESYLVTSDLDVLQLVNPHTHIYTLKKGFTQIELFNEESFKAKYSVEPTQWIDVKALKGDSSDNIPGVAGVGEKTAIELIKQYGNLEAVYDNIELIKPTVKKKLEASKDMAFLSKKLVTLMVDAPVKLDFEKAKLSDNVTPEFVAMLRKLEFRTLLRQAEAQLSKTDKVQAEEPANVLEPAKRVDLSELNLANQQPRVVALSPAGDELWVSGNSKTYAVISLANGVEDDAVEVMQHGEIIGHDLKDLLSKLLAKNYSWVGKVGHDTKIGAFLLNSLERLRELSDLVEQPVDVEDASKVIAAIWRAYDDQKLQFEQLPQITKLAHEVEFPTIDLLAKIEHRGIRLDSDFLKQMSKKFAVRINEFEEKIFELAGQTFNIASPTQLANILFEVMGLPTMGIKKGKTGYSTGAKELDKLRGLNPIVDLITQYREYTKLKSTYIDALPKLVDEQGKLHTDFRLDVAATGRLSSANPNLQNIPTRTEIGQAIRSAFVPAEGNVFVSADYSQFELRLAAVLADDKKMIEEFNKDADIHTATAAEFYGVSMSDVTKDQRRNAKTINFGVLYGMSPHGLSVGTGMSMIEARDFIKRYFELRAPIRIYMDDIVQQAARDGFVQTMFGRRRPTPDLKSSNFAVREAAKRAAINMPIQGTEADLMKIAMLRVEEELGDLGQQILQIHDSILVECPAVNAPKVEKILQKVMEEVCPELPVKLKVDVKTGANWGEL
ncbi:MAG TPA: DNA polymerase I [Candidatus Saccharimonadales bacterium]|nr:DNA polymerase I [Candidatus Saccharimonadales bacterium]